MTWSQIFKETAKSILGVVAIVAIVISFGVLMMGCSSAGEITDHMGDTGDNIEDVVRSGEEIVQEAGEAAEEAKETGKKLRSLRSKKFTLELAKGSSLENVRVRVRPAGANKHKVIPAGGYARYGLDVTRFAESANFSIYTELNGEGRAIKVRQEYRSDRQNGPAELLVLTKVGESRFAWLPPSERDDDETIIYDGH
jgi:hypothetical protein